MNSSFGGPGGDGGATISRMNDISPQDIESIEIIKGPPAATLYGTEASAGVIQILTKRGAVVADICVTRGVTCAPDFPKELCDLARENALVLKSSEQVVLRFFARCVKADLCCH